tara:strand:+ start:575 stop:838 length:264 start_codon:yes stop_codon:yes gene_type:complete
MKEKIKALQFSFQGNFNCSLESDGNLHVKHTITLADVTEGKLTMKEQPIQELQLNVKTLMGFFNNMSDHEKLLKLGTKQLQELLNNN